MSGHSKWSKVKHQKAVTDVVKGAAFTKASRAITIAVKEGGGPNPEHNFRLRLAIEQARAVNMPKDTIERAIAKAAGAGSAAIEQVLYEGYGPGGVAFLVEAATDNRQRTVSQVKNVLEKAGGRLAAPGAVAYLFAKSGVLTIPKAGVSFERVFDVAAAAGADDVVEVADVYEVYAAPEKLHAMQKELTAQGMAIDNAQLIMRPTANLPPSDDAVSAAVDMLTEHLESLDDVQRVYTNMV